MTAGLTKNIQMRQRNFDNTDWDIHHPETTVTQIIGLATTSDMSYFVSPTGSDSNDGLSSGQPFKTLQHAFDILPTFVNHTVNVNVAAGTYSEEIIATVAGAGTININGNVNSQDSYSIKRLRFLTCTAEIYVNGVKLAGSSDNVGIEAINCRSVQSISNNIYGSSSGSGSGIKAINSTVHSYSTLMSGFYYGAFAGYMAKIYSDSWRTTASISVGIVATEGSIIAKNGIQPTGSAVAEQTSTGGVIR